MLIGINFNNFGMSVSSLGLAVAERSKLCVNTYRRWNRATPLLAKKATLNTIFSLERQTRAAGRARFEPATQPRTRIVGDHVRVHRLAPKQSGWSEVNCMEVPQLGHYM